MIKRSCPPVVWSVALLLSCMCGASFAQAPISQASKDELIGALGGPDWKGSGLRGKAFTRTAPPDALSHGCPEAAASTGRKNLVVYSQDAPDVNLNIQFATDSDAIKAESDALLSTMAQALMDESMRQVKVTVAGHTDGTGSRDHNLVLSCARAIAVRNRLIQLGVEAERLGVYGFGPDRPLETGAVESAANRRVEIRRAS